MGKEQKKKFSTSDSIKDGCHSLQWFMPYVAGSDESRQLPDALSFSLGEVTHSIPQAVTRPFLTQKTNKQFPLLAPSRERTPGK